MPLLPLLPICVFVKTSIRLKYERTQDLSMLGTMVPFVESTKYSTEAQFGLFFCVTSKINVGSRAEQKQF